MKYGKAFENHFLQTFTIFTLVVFMPALDTLLTACIQTPTDPTKRRPSVKSTTSTTQSKTPSFLTIVERSFDEFIEKVSQVPLALEESFDELANTVREVPAVVEEKMEDISQSYYGSWKRLKLSLFPARTGRGKIPCIKVSRHDFEQVDENNEPKTLKWKTDVTYEDLLSHSVLDSKNLSQASFHSSSNGSIVDSLPPDFQNEISVLSDLRENLHLMELSSPGLRSPETSPELRVSETDTGSVVASLDEQIGGSDARSSGDYTLVSDGTVGDCEKVKWRDLESTREGKRKPDGVNKDGESEIHSVAPGIVAV